MLHVIYIFSILISLLIIIATVKFSENQALVDKINFAAAISSLILAVLAIVYAVYSNASVSGSISSLMNAAEKVSNSTGDLTSISNKIEIFSGKIDESVEKLSVSTLSVNERIAAHQFDMKTISQQLKDMSSSMGKRTEGSKVDIEEFLNVCSFSGLLALAAYSKSAEIGRTLSTEVVFDSMSINGNYLFGFLVAANCAGVINNFDLKDLSELRSTGIRDYNYKPFMVKVEV